MLKFRTFLHPWLLDWDNQNGLLEESLPAIFSLLAIQDLDLKKRNLESIRISYL
jgi:hypothetical protein